MEQSLVLYLIQYNYKFSEPTGFEIFGDGLKHWLIGRHIVEFEQDGKAYAIYGSKLLSYLQKDLTHLLGKGFSRSNLQYMRLL